MVLQGLCRKIWETERNTEAGTVRLPHWAEAGRRREKGMRVEILDEDEDIIVVYKPAGIAAQTADVGQEDVVSELKNYLSRTPKAAGKERQEPYLGVIHRLDQPVEGLLVFAKRQNAAAALSRQLRDGAFCKRYYAVLCGRPEAEKGQLTDALCRDGAGRMGEVARAGQKADTREAVLHYSVLQSLEERPITLADIQVDTGRFHQIRVLMAHAGTPILGDRKYGGEACCALARDLQVQYVALCAYYLEFIHPGSKKVMKYRIKPRGRVFSFFSQL